LIPFVRQSEVEYGRCERLSPLVRRVVAHNPGPFTYTGTGTYLVGSGEVAVIDPGPLDEVHLGALLKALEGERVTRILITHSHLDHSPLAAALQQATGAVVYGRSAAAAHTPSGPRTEEGSQTLFRPDVEVEEGQPIAGPGWTFEPILTPGHASNHVAYALAEEQALFSGDHVMGWSTTVVSPPDGAMGDYLRSLDKVRARTVATLWPTHGPAIADPGPFLDAYQAHRLDREEQILGQLRAGRTQVSEIVPVLYAAVDQRLWPAAAQSVLAHLAHLVESGRVSADGPPDLGRRYGLA
jgi:glyoxylase-like metal-dependent hydrolase (beta-lactamase superfamily II)